jgi:flagellar motor switch protein FliG
MVNLLDSSMGTALMTDIAKSDERLSHNIQDLMFVFADLLKIDDRGMQELLRQVPADKLLISLKGADEEFKAKVFKNMSQRAGEMLKSDLEAKGPVRLSEVEAAQKEILMAARKLADEGTINLGGASGEEYV